MLKSEIINQALSQAEISGLTRSGSPEEMTITFNELEQMMGLWLGRDIDVGYRFNESTGEDFASESGVPRWAHTGVISNLSIAILEYFGKSAHPNAQRKAKAGLSVIQSKTYVPQNVNYPSRMPLGQGNRRGGYNRSSFYPDSENPLTDSIIRLHFGNVVNPRPIDMSAYLEEDETICEVSAKSPDCLEVTCLQIDGDLIRYQVKSTKNSSEQLKAAFTITTSCGRVTTREQWFEIKATSIDNC
jgi:hypothetical protein